jgi:hypothetical protein
LAIHASKAKRNFYDDQLIYELCEMHPAIYRATDDERIDEEHQIFHFGAIIGMVDVIDCVAYDPLRDDESDLFGRFDYLTADGPAPELPVAAWAEGPYCFVLSNPRRFAQPIACSGKLSLWSLTPELQQAIATAGQFTLTDPGQPSQPPQPLGEPAAAGGKSAAKLPATAKADAKAEQRREWHREQRRRKILGK